MDVESKGFLSISSVQQAFTQASPSIKPEVIAAAFQELDVGRTGMISYQQFVWITRVAADEDGSALRQSEKARASLLQPYWASSIRDTAAFRLSQPPALPSNPRN